MKPAAVTLQIPMSVDSVQVVTAGACGTEKTSCGAPPAEFQQKFHSLCSALDRAVEDISAYGQNLFAIHREQIVHLAVQIAARILASEIQDRHYQMEKILAAVIDHAPVGELIEIHLNPEDFKTCETWLNSQQTSLNREIKLTQDWSVQQAECIVYTPEGIMEYRMEEHLRQIENAMKKQNAAAESPNQI